MCHHNVSSTSRSWWWWSSILNWNKNHQEQVNAETDFMTVTYQHHDQIINNVSVGAQVDFKCRHLSDVPPCARASWSNEESCHWQLWKWFVGKGNWICGCYSHACGRHNICEIYCNCLLMSTVRGMGWNGWMAGNQREYSSSSHHQKHHPSSHQEE